MDDDNVLRRWFSLEMGKLLEQHVPAPRPLTELLRETRPRAKTRSGDLHEFDPVALRSFADVLPPLTRAQARLPITLHMDHETPGDAYAAEPWAVDCLLALRVSRNPPRDGRLWVSAPLARDVAQRYPTLFQFVMH